MLEHVIRRGALGMAHLVHNPANLRQLPIINAATEELLQISLVHQIPSYAGVVQSSQFPDRRQWTIRRNRLYPIIVTGEWI
jgi:hypothetical protein